ncbi:MAG: chorismate-binding protein [Candidatus Nanopelagicales bacterium]
MTRNLVALGQKASANLVEVTTDLGNIEDSGTWIVLAYFETPIVALRFEDWTSIDEHTDGGWSGCGKWESLTSEDKYIQLVNEAKSQIADGIIYQVNVCRQLRSKMTDERDLFSLYRALQTTDYSENLFYIRLNAEVSKYFNSNEIEIVSFSPEVFLSRKGDLLTTKPIKGTAKKDEEFLQKDIAENIMIVDLMRNDLSKVCKEDSISVPTLLTRSELPYASQLVSEVRGQIQPGKTWHDIFEATFPPGSVSGAPKSSALKFISECESERNIYCGAFGIIDSTNKDAVLNVAIRTFWKDGEYLYYGTGAGITWGSDAETEWEETELKAQTLLELVSKAI